MRDRSKEIPSDPELREAGVELGLLEPGQPVPPRLRGRLARVVQEAWREGAEQKTNQVTASAFSAPVLAIMAELTTATSPISETSAAHIVAAVAPSIWRGITKSDTPKKELHTHDR